MVYDCFQFFNEIDILLLRLHIMDPIVDKFVISESTVTFSGKPKPLNFKQHEELFKDFSSKIIYQVVDDTPSDLTYSHDRDYFQKDAVARALKDCNDDDIIIFSDLDEIPNPDTISSIIPSIDSTKVYHLAQRMFYCYMNMEEISGNLLSCSGEFEGITEKKWLGTKVFTYKFYKDLGLGLSRYRFPELKEKGIRVSNGGWHFGYMGGLKEADISKRIKDKVVSAAHTEVNKKSFLSEAKDQIESGNDMFGREATFIQTEIDESYPVYLREHIAEYSHLIKQPDSQDELKARNKRISRRENKRKFIKTIKGIVKKIIGRA